MANYKPKPDGRKKKKEQPAKGAARNYVTRTQALKKLQCTLADFRRLCILKGIFPREPRHRKKALKNATATTTFYYAKDIQYLLHEPVLQKLRDHKAFAKKLSRALVRTQWGLAKNLEETRPTYRLDHIIKERYPTFNDSLRDMDDAISLIVLFAHLPASETVSHSVIQNCMRLVAEWQLYVVRTRSLRKVFLSIKGIYFQAVVKGQPITWLVPYSFTQHVPTDVDFRVMLTFIELYQTLLGFAFFRLYTDENLVYPPELDLKREEAAAGMGALVLAEASPSLTIQQADGDGPAKTVTAGQVKKQIKAIKATATEDDEDDRGEGPSNSHAETESTDAIEPTDSDARPNLFEPYYFFLSREVTRPTLEFVIRSFGGQVGWDPVLGGGSPFSEMDTRITHHIVDRPVVEGAMPIEYPGKRVLVQPQWVVDSVNSRKILPSDIYAPGQVLPPHLSPFVDDKAVKAAGGYVPAEADPSAAIDHDEEESEEEELDEMDEDAIDEDEEFGGIASDAEPEAAEQPVVSAKKAGKAPALAAIAHDDDLLHQAELEAETRGVSFSQFQSDLSDAKKDRSGKKARKAKASAEEIEKLDANPTATSMLTGKMKKVYRKMSYTRERQAEEKQALEKKKRALKGK